MVTLVNVPRYIALLKNYASKPTLTKWLMNEGDRVEESQPLVVVETTKSSLEIQAPASGNIYYLRQVGDKVTIGDTLGIIAEGKVEIAQFQTLLTKYQWT